MILIYCSHMSRCGETWPPLSNDCCCIVHYLWPGLICFIKKSLLAARFLMKMVFNYALNIFIFVNHLFYIHYWLTDNSDTQTDSIYIHHDCTCVIIELINYHKYIILTSPLVHMMEQQSISFKCMCVLLCRAVVKRWRLIVCSRCGWPAPSLVLKTRGHH